MFTVKQAIKASAMIDKLGLVITKDPNATEKEVGIDMITQIVKNAHKAEQEIYEFIASAKKCSIEEAEEADIIEVIKEKMKDAGMLDFFKSAVKSEPQE